MSNQTRRDLLASIGTLGTAGLAGCATNTNPESTSTNTPSETENPENPPSDSNTSAETSENNPWEQVDMNSRVGESVAPDLRKAEHKTDADNVGFRFTFSSDALNARNLDFRPAKIEVYNRTELGQVDNLIKVSPIGTDPVEIHFDNVHRWLHFRYYDGAGFYWRFSVELDQNGTVASTDTHIDPDAARIRAGGDPYTYSDAVRLDVDDAVNVRDSPKEDWAGPVEFVWHLFEAPDEAGIEWVLDPRKIRVNELEVVVKERVGGDVLSRTVHRTDELDPAGVCSDDHACEDYPVSISTETFPVPVELTLQRVDSTFDDDWFISVTFNEYGVVQSLYSMGDAW